MCFWIVMLGCGTVHQDFSQLNGWSFYFWYIKGCPHPGLTIKCIPFTHLPTPPNQRSIQMQQHHHLSLYFYMCKNKYIQWKIYSILSFTIKLSKQSISYNCDWEKTQRSQFNSRSRSYFFWDNIPSCYVILFSQFIKPVKLYSLLEGPVLKNNSLAGLAL